MNLATQLLRQIDDPTLSRDERARLRCQLARELEEAGNYEAARGAMGDLWQSVESRPQLEGLDERTAAEVLLRAGTLSGWIGSSKQIEGAQEFAKNLISESRTIFESLQDTEKAAEALTDLAYCYWREGASDEARVILGNALSRLADYDSDVKAVALLRSAIVESSATRNNDALRILIGAKPLFEASADHAIKGKFHTNLAIVLRNLGTAERREDYTDRALVEYSAASFHYEQAGHTRYRARVENNLGFLLLKLGRFDEAYPHLDRARRLFVGLNDSGSVAQVDDTRALALLAQGRNSEAERIALVSVHALENGGEQALLAESLTTYGIALARLNRHEQARSTLQRAIEVAHTAGSNEGAGLAALAMLEELSDQFSRDELRVIYQRATNLLAKSQHPETPARLVALSCRVLDIEENRAKEFSAPNFIYASEQTETLLRNAHHVASTSSTILITGETGTGKEVLARMIHEWSGRAGELVAINCAAIPDALIESQLFGHRKGSFTDAVADYAGAVRQAANGTLFLDEIGELSSGNQAKILRLIENGEIHPVGAPTPEQVDVRIIAATNRNLREQVKKSLFRDDLLYRLNTFHLEIPPLRERQDDIPVIAGYFIREMQERHRRRVTFTPEAIAAMRMLPLRGNARELQSLIERTVLTAKDGATITVEAVETVALRQTQIAGFAYPWANFSLREEVRLYEERFIALALKEAKGMITRAARLLGLHHDTLNYRLTHQNKNLQHTRKPVEKRKRNIFRL
ncbi:MAG: sigma 54-interacting transcriptional regulator [Pyrinomonadaceae bacterium]